MDQPTSMRKLLRHRNIQTALSYIETDREDVKHELVETGRGKREQTVLGKDFIGGLTAV